MQLGDVFLYDVRASAGGIGLLLFGMFIVGAAFGSFFNVVAFRLPRQMSLLHPPSTCPACKRPIRWYDNVPIFSWLWLGGRCRDCRAAISPRYPLVESLVAAATLLVAASSIEHLDIAASEHGFALDPLRLVFQMMLVYTLFCAALLEFDGSRLGAKTLAVMLLAAAVLPALAPDVRPGGSSRSGYDSLVIAAAALVLGGLAWPMLLKTTDQKAIRAALGGVAELTLVGLVLGLSALVAVTVLASAGYLATSAAHTLRQRIGWAAWLLVATLIWISAGSRLLEILPALRSPWALAAAGGAEAALAIAARFVRDGIRPGRVT